MSNIISYILFYVIWVPLCLVLLGTVMLWAVLYTGFNYITGIGWEWWLVIIIISFYLTFPIYALYQTHTNPNSFNKFGKDFNLEKAQEKIKQHNEKQKKYWKKHSKEHKVTTWKDRPQAH